MIYIECNEICLNLTKNISLDSGDGCTTMQMYLMPLNSTFKSS